MLVVLVALVALVVVVLVVEDAGAVVVVVVSGVGVGVSTVTLKDGKVGRSPPAVCHSTATCHCSTPLSARSQLPGWIPH